jgi:hypothetical protein
MRIKWKHKFSGKEGSSDKEAFQKWANQHPSDAARYEVIGEFDDSRPMIVDRPTQTQAVEEEE